jgi:hypothetical protein
VVIRHLVPPTLATGEDWKVPKFAPERVRTISPDVGPFPALIVDTVGLPKENRKSGAAEVGEESWVPPGADTDIRTM